MSSDEFWEYGCAINKHRSQIPNTQGMRRFLGFFGAKPVVCSKVWFLILFAIPTSTKPRHLLWALLFLRGYDTEEKNASAVGVDENTFRWWIKQLVPVLAFQLDVVMIFIYESSPYNVFLK